MTMHCKAFLRSLRPRRRTIAWLAAAAGAGAGALLLGALPATATTFAVNTTADIAATSGATTCPATCSLRAALEAANNTGGTITITIPAGTYDLSLGELRLGTFPGGAGVSSYDVTVQGAGAASTVIRQTDGVNRVWDLDPSVNGNVNVHIDGMTVTGGHDAADQYGGAGIIAGAPPGGVLNNGVTAADNLTLSNCLVTDNHVSSTTSVGRPGGGLTNVGGNVTVTNCTFSSNSSGSSEGGGVYYDSLSPNDGTLTITGSTFSGNSLANTTTAQIGGAALKTLGTTASVYRISSSVFSGNVATATGTGTTNGGAISSNRGSLQVTTSSFTGNHADGPAGTRAGGGAISVDTAGEMPSSFYVRLNRFIGNSATNGPGGVYAAQTLDFANNWWGCNAGPGNAGCDAAGGSATTSPRLVLSATASPSSVLVSQASTVTASLKRNSADQDTGVLLGATLRDGVGVSFGNGSLGGVAPLATTLSNGVAGTTYTAGSTGGADQVTATVDNQTVSVGITVNQPPHITSAGSTTFAVGTAGSLQMTATGYPAPTFSTTGTLPSGVTLSSGGLLSGTPATGSGGVYALPITASNGVTPNDTQSFTLTVNEAPSITSASTTTFTVGQAGSFTVTATGWPAPSITLTGGGVPGGVSYNSSTHVISGTPVLSTGGTYAWQFTAHNTSGADSVQSFSLVVQERAGITSGSEATFVVGSPGSFTVTTGGYPVPTITEVGALPAGVTLVDNGNGTATLAGTPSSGAAGLYPLTMRAHNGVLSDATQAFSLHVNQAASFSSAATVTFQTGVAGSFTVQAAGLPIPTLTESGVLPGGVSFVDNGNGTGTLAGTPAAGTGGSYTLSFTAHNGVGSDANQTFGLVINQPPAFTSIDHATFDVGVPGSFLVTTSGYPALTGPIGVVGTPPSGVWFTNNGNGTETIQGTPAAGTAGVYTFSFSASNGVSPDAAQTFTLTVAGAPSITSAAGTTFVVGQAGSFTITATGSTPMTISETGALPSGVTLVDHGDRTATLAGTPASGGAGTYPLSITASNGITPDATQSFTLQVDAVAAITSSNTTTFVTGTAGSFTVTATGTPTPVLTVTGTLPAGLSFTDNGNGTATLGGTPAGGTGGAWPISLAAHSGVGSDATQAFTITVDQPAVITSGSAVTFTTGIPGSFTVTATGYPVPTLDAGSSPLPAGVSFVDNGNGTATLSGTPAADTGGVWPISLTAHNGVGSDATQVLQLSVQMPPILFAPATATFTVGTLGSVEISTSGYPAPAVTKSGDLPAGLSFVDNGNGTATLSGTPAAGSGGQYSLNLTATNGVGSVTQPLVLTVDEAPVITSADHVAFTVGTPASFSVTTRGYPAPAISVSDILPGGSLPTGLTLTDNGNGTATLAGTPAAGTGLTYLMTFHASNGVGTDAQGFELDLNEAVSFTSPAATTFMQGTDNYWGVTTVGYPRPAIIEVGALPAGLAFTDYGYGMAALSGIPAVGTGGVYAIQFQAGNGQTGAVQDFVLSVQEKPAFTSANHATFTVGAAGDFTVTTAGYPAPSLVELGALPSGVSFADNGDGTARLSGTPASGSGGVYSIVFHAVGAGDALQTFTLTVDQAPAFTSAASATFVVGTSGSFSVQTTGYPAAAISWSGTLPSGVGFHDNGDGTATLSGTPAGASGGTYGVHFLAANGVAPAATQEFSLVVDEAPAITSAATTTFQANTAGSFAVTTRGYPIPGITESGALPTGVSFHDNGDGTATLGGTPTGSTSGMYPLTLSAANGVGSAATQAFTLIVGAAPTTTAVSGPATPTFGQAVAYTATVTPVPPATGTPTGTVTFSVDGVAQATVSLSGGTASWTTSSLQPGAHVVRATYNGQAGSFLASYGTRSVSVGCATTYTGAIKGGLSIKGGSACVVNARISGGVSVSNGASVSIRSSTVNNGITSTGARMLSVCGDTTSVGGAITVSGSTGFVLIGSAGDDPANPCSANTVGGGITLSNNSGGFELGGNSVRGAVVVNNNVLAAGVQLDVENAAPEIESNTIKGSLSCSGNVPAPTDDLKPNRVTGTRSGQCGGSGF